MGIKCSPPMSPKVLMEAILLNAVFLFTANIGEYESGRAEQAPPQSPGSARRSAGCGQVRFTILSLPCDIFVPTLSSPQLSPVIIFWKLWRRVSLCSAEFSI